MNSQYADRIVGFMVTAGNTGEWFDINTYQNPNPDFDRCQDNIEHFRIWLVEKYQTGAALQTAWNNTIVTNEYKVYIFANAFVLDSQQRAAIEGLKRNSKSLVFIKLPAILDPDTKVPSLINAADLTELDLRLAVSSAVPPV